MENGGKGSCAWSFADTSTPQGFWICVQFHVAALNSSKRNMFQVKLLCKLQSAPAWCCWRSATQADRKPVATGVSVSRSRERFLDSARASQAPLTGWHARRWRFACGTRERDDAPGRSLPGLTQTLYMQDKSLQQRVHSGAFSSPTSYYGSLAHAKDTRLALRLLGALLALGTLAFVFPRWFLFASSARVRYPSLAIITFALGLSLGSYELGNIKRLPLTIAMATLGRLLLMPLATALLVFPLGIQLDAASVSSLLLIAASPSGYATLWIAALTNTTIRELAAMMTFSSVAASALTIPLLLLIAAAVARFPSSVGVADYLVASTGAPAILWYASLYVLLVTVPLLAGCVGAIFAPPAPVDRLRRVLRPVSWISIALLTLGTMASSRTARVMSGSRGVFVASLLMSLIGLLFGLIGGRLAGHSPRVRRTFAYELAFPGLAVAAATAPAETTGLACAATLAAQILLLLGMNVYQQFRKGYLGESVIDMLSIQAFSRSIE